MNNFLDKLSKIDSKPVLKFETVCMITLTLILISLKSVGIINCGWAWIFCPIWIPFVFYLIVFIILVIILVAVVIPSIGKDVWKKYF